MGVILSIEWVKEWVDAKGVAQSRTYAIVDSKSRGIVELEGYGKDYKVGDNVQVLYHDKFDQAKMQKSRGVDKSIANNNDK